MLTVVAVLAALAAAGIAGRWATRRTDSLGRARAFPVISVVLLSLIAAGSAVPLARHRMLERRLTATTTALVGTRAVVHCQNFGQAMVDIGSELGWVRFGSDGIPEHSTLVKREPCAQLSAYVHGGRSSPGLDRVTAVHVLSHEARHMAGSTSESIAECQAVQRDALTARLLGATAEQASALAGRYWTEVYPRMPVEYQSRDCRLGGPLDEHLADAPWASGTALRTSGGR